MVHNLIVFCGLQIFKSSKNYHIQIIFVLHVRWQHGEQAVLFSVSFELTDITDVQQMSADDVLPGFTHLLQSHLLLGHAHPNM